MQAVILAAGKGTRMRPLTYDIPKPMLPINEKPVLEHTLNFLPEEIDEVIFVINYLGKHIKKHFGSSWKGRKIKYVFQGELNGTGGALHICKDLVKEKFLVVMGDDLYFKKDLEKMMKEDLAILAQEVDDPSRFGVLKTDAEGKLIDIIEKPKMKGKGLVSTNAFILDEKFFDYDLVQITDTEFGLPQTVSVMAKDFPVKVMKTTRWMAVGCPEDLKRAEKEIEKFYDF
jgi:UDP-N-acetylglucosamine diphosphorylase / glucose-1-phosphate thymidylyltransferase / UDP-N-acetylgalactosamine diphosphorylase / glucosamine-1-phosphate N-acetyltransferase / galactosamine-1-phosphate N-acetyltransferase